MQVEVSIHELLAAAREAVKSDYIKGESILCETRYHPDTHYMVEIEMLKTDNTLGEYYGAAEPPVRCGESHLSGLTEPPHFIY